MKLVLRIFAFAVVVAGAAAASVAPKSSHEFASHQSATAALPTPGCVPGLPTCGSNPGK
ncbi:MAG TPA: hypothetical protein VKR52_21605 [Terracidiphilus sp.]|nr:hypothetical protein [Terracidiphilus sp.]